MALGFYPQRGTFLGAPTPPAIKQLAFPAPKGGINAVDPMATLSPEYCTYSVNMIPDGPGQRVRSGYAEYAADLAGVRTLIPFSASNDFNSRLFAVSNFGIYDITGGGAGPWTVDAGFSNTGASAGWGTWVNYVSDGGSHFCFYADEANGLYRMQEGGAWAAVTDITGVTPADLTFTVSHKGRAWFVQRGTADAWYLDPGAVAGGATVFHLGSKFQHGGTLVGIYNWTVDGGDGVDDYLVFVGSEGDVLVYRFDDPDIATTYSQAAQYYVGKLPAGRRVAAQNGGELFLLTQYGVLPMSTLVSGRPVQEQDAYASRTITPYIAAQMSTKRAMRGWELKAVPYENVFLVATPKDVGLPYRQFAMSTRTRSWTLFEDLQYVTGDTYNGVFYFAGPTSVWQLGGSQDAVEYGATEGTAISFSLMTSFQDLDGPALFHQVQLIRPVFRAGGSLDYSVDSRYDYNTDDFVPSLSPVVVSGDLWDFGVWDSAVWGGAAITRERAVGGVGLGRAVGIALAGKTLSETTLLRIDVLFTTGGVL